MLDFLTPEKVVAKSLKLSLQESPRAIAQQESISQVIQFRQSRRGSTSTPLTVKQIAKQLGYDRRTISRHFPELCHAISTKSQSYRKASRLRKIEQSCEEVQQIVLELRNKGADQARSSCI